MKDVIRYAICLVIGYVVLWYAGAQFGFFPFLGDSKGVGFTGLLIVIVIVVCTCWIIETIQRQGGERRDSEEKTESDSPEKSGHEADGC